MIIVDNKLQVAKTRLAYILTISAGSLLVIYSVFSSPYAEGKLLSLIIGLITLSLFLYLLIIKPEYIFFAVQDNSKLVVRNYTAFPVFRKYKAYEVPISSLFDYEIKKAFFNKIIFLRIMVKSKNQIGKYPWLSLSIVPAKDIGRLISSLNNLIPAENQKKKL